MLSGDTTPRDLQKYQNQRSPPLVSPLTVLSN